MSEGKQTNTAEDRRPRPRSPLHRGVRVAQRLMRILLVISTITTAVFFIIPIPVVVAPAIVMGICFCAVLGLNYWERLLRADVEATAEPVLTPPESTVPEGETEEELAPEIPRPTRKARRTGIKVVGGILLGLVAISVILAGLIFEWKLAVIAAFVAFVWLLITGAPFWLAAALDETEDVREEVTDESVPHIR